MSSWVTHKPRHFLSSRLFSLLEDACYRLDIRASESADHQQASRQSSFQKYCRCQRELRELQEEKRRLEEEATILEQAATYMTLQMAPQSTEDATLLRRMQEGSSERRANIHNIVRDIIITVIIVHAK